ncbi:MAG: bifunctional [glutamate--ammonia ligase]-adenylyl-L-tyrosine phosphorylase/[glutamate--ammonia-ligase] adenylyltransferase [Verrucomicrobia bacterium]|nr:bifunctional [glutamate--ammonia ligase]-adenylyl-L-tyrosine phosphorylase/[glutamate--ammonia-ligase] adenylyltransferase [Verrucomicrobiota bacterium]
MSKQVWPNAIASSADPARCQHFYDLFRAVVAAGVLKNISAEEARIFASIFSGSQALSELLLSHPDWLATSLNAEMLQYPRQEQGLRREVNAWLPSLLRAKNYAGAFARLREFKQREQLRIAARDLARLADVTEITRELSNVADVCLHTVAQLCFQQLSERLGWPYHLDAGERWQRTEFCVLGLGKLGGQELNYSSDVDVIFVYADEGSVFREPPRKAQLAGKSLSNHQFFKRLAEAFVAEVGELAPEGALYRIDLRLRPEGNAGPLVRSLASYENFYAQWGQTWERMMLIKARRVAGNEALAGEFLEMIQPFRYARSLGERIFREIAAMKRRIETEVVKAGELERNVKLGRGGIREIEFIVQTLQLLHAGRVPFLQSAQTIPALQKLAEYHLLSEDDAAALAAAHRFLRDTEHRLQMENNLQTHTIPTERKARERLARLMDFGSLAEFETARRSHTSLVRAVYDKLLHSELPTASGALPGTFAGAETGWEELLAEHGFKDVETSFRLFRGMVDGPGFIHVSQRTSELARELLPRFFALCPKISQASILAATSAAGSSVKILSDPDRVLNRLDSFVAAYGARATLYETWTNNPSLFELLLWLFDRSEFLAEVAIRTPDLVDELVLSGRLRRAKTAAEILADLRFGLDDTDQRRWLRRYHQVELMRIGLRDILGLAEFENNLVELSALAEACLQYALEVALRKNKFKNAPVVVVGLGKLGGAELTYGSDLDIVFVAEPDTKNLPALQRLAIDVMDLLSRQTEQGIAFVTDARLRPDGEKGLLVNTLDVFEDYYVQRSQLWEIQALTRTRPVAGNVELGQRFQQLVAKLTNFNRPSLLPAAYSSGWRSEIARMRERIEKERTSPGKNRLAIKTGAGGLIDAEFIAQTLCLAHGWHEPNTLKALERARDSAALPGADADLLITNYRQLRRIESILRRWSYEGEVLLPDNPAPLQRVAVRCGFADAAAFMQAVDDHRAAIRSVYERQLVSA